MVEEKAAPGSEEGQERDAEKEGGQQVALFHPSVHHYSAPTAIKCSHAQLFARSSSNPSQQNANAKSAGLRWSVLDMRNLAKGFHSRTHAWPSTSRCSWGPPRTFALQPPPRRSGGEDRSRAHLKSIELMGKSAQGQ